MLSVDVFFSEKYAALRKFIMQEAVNESSKGTESSFPTLYKGKNIQTFDLI